MRITDRAEADADFRALVEEHLREEELDLTSPTNRKVRSNIAVFAALSSPRDFERIERLFKTSHLYYPPTREQLLLLLGEKAGMRAELKIKDPKCQ